LRISHRHRFVFFSNPRTGSTSLRDFLDPLSDFHGAILPSPPAQPFHDHMRPIDARREFERLGLDYGAYYKFVFVRNPWARLASLYVMIRSLRPDFRQPFPEWLATVQPFGRGGGGNGGINETWRQYGAYSLAAFAGDGTGLLVDDVFRLEDADRVPDILRRKGIPLPAEAVIGRKNQTRGSVDLRQLYGSRRAIDFVGDLYADDIRRFRYRFPES
jgi:hypothetical protein